MFSTFLAQFSHYFQSRSISLEAAKNAGFELLDGEAVAEAVGDPFNRSPLANKNIKKAGILIPYFNFDGKTELSCRIRFLEETQLWDKEKQRYKPARYKAAPGSENFLFLPRVEGLDWEKVQHDVSRPIMFTEGEVKALSSTINLGIPTIGLSGVWNWQVAGKPIEMLSDFTWSWPDKLEKRTVYICFDTDVEENLQVMRARLKLNNALLLLGANVLLVDLPAKGPKGIDDYIGVFGAEDAKQLIKKAYPICMNPEDSPTSQKYVQIMDTARKAIRGQIVYNENSEKFEHRDKRLKRYEWEDIYQVIQDTFSFKITPEKDLKRAVELDAKKDFSYHPIKAYLRSLSTSTDNPGYRAWKEGTLFKQVFGFENPLFETLLKKFLLASVARIEEPGCPMDWLIILYAPDQGIGKSQFLRVLFGAQNINASLPDLSKDYEAAKAMRGKWVGLFDEIDKHTDKYHSGVLKDFVDKPRDDVHILYKDDGVSVERSWVLFGTTNKLHFLTDETGARRYVPIQVTEEINCELLGEMRDGIWLAAFEAYKESSGPIDWLLDFYENEELQDIREACRVRGQYDDAAEEFLAFYGEPEQFSMDKEFWPYLPVENAIELPFRNNAIKATVSAAFASLGYYPLPNPVWHTVRTIRDKGTDIARLWENPTRIKTRCWAKRTPIHKKQQVGF